MRIGYGRVSTRDQNPDAQHDALTAAGCDQTFVEKVSGILARRPQLERSLLVLRAGDQLVITKLDRLGRSLEDLMAISKQLQERGVDLVVLDQGIDTSTAIGRMFFQILGSVAEFEHALMSERTHDGLAAARARGRIGGQKPKLGSRQVALARAMYEETGHSGRRRYTVAQIAAEFGVTRPTIYRHLAAQTPPGDQAQGSRPTPEPSPETADAAPAVTASPARRRVIDLSEELADGAEDTWQLIETEPGTWQVHRAGAQVAIVRRATTSRGRRGWRARLANGIDLPAHGQLAAPHSTLWRTRDLAAAGIADHVTRSPR